jgi:hypothetical protein
MTPVSDFCEVYEEPLGNIALEDIDDKPINEEEFIYLKENVSKNLLPIYNEIYIHQKIMEMKFCRKFVSKMII